MSGKTGWKTGLRVIGVVGMLELQQEASTRLFTNKAKLCGVWALFNVKNIILRVVVVENLGRCWRGQRGTHFIELKIKESIVSPL